MFLRALLFLLLVCPLFSGVIVLKNGKKIKCKSYEVKGKSLHYKDHDGNLFQLPLKIVDLEKCTDEEVDPNSTKISTRHVIINKPKPKPRARNNVDLYEVLGEEDRITTSTEGSAPVPRDTGPAYVSTSGRGGSNTFELVQAVRNKDGKAVGTVLSRNMSLDPRDFKEQRQPYPLFIAVEDGSVAILEQMLNWDFNLEAKDRNGRTALHLSLSRAADEFKTIGKMLLKAGANPNEPDNDGNPPMIFALKSYNFEMIKALIDYEVDPNGADGHGRSYLDWAVHNSDFKAMKVLLNAGAKPSEVTLSGYTLVQKVIVEDNLEMLNILLESNADPNQASAAGKSSLLLAIELSRVKLIGALLKKGAVLGLEKETTPLIFSVKKSGAPMVKVFLNEGLPVNAKDAKGNTALHYAAEKSLDMVRLLLGYGADPKIKNEKQKWPIDYASGPDEKIIKKTLKEVMLVE